MELVEASPFNPSGYGRPVAPRGASLALPPRQIFVVDAPRQEVPGNLFQKRLRGILDQFTKLQEKQDDVALYLYGFSAPQKKVQQSHDDWEKKLELVNQKLQAETDVMHEAFQDLPFVDDCIPGFHTMIVLMVKQYTISQKNSLLLSWLQAPEYEVALTFCKTKISQAEAIFNVKGGDADAKLLKMKLLVEEIVQAIEMSREKTEGLDSKVRQGIQIVHKQVVRFYRYCIDSLVLPVSFVNLGDELLTKLKTVLPSRSDVDEAADLLEQLSLDPPPKRALDLKSNRYFRHGQWFTKARYPTIYPTIEKMQETAAEMQEFQEQQERRCREFTQPGSADAIIVHMNGDQQALEHLKKTLDRQREELLKLAYTDEIHAGLYYARELLSLVQESEFTCKLLSSIATSPFQNICDALKKLVAFIGSNPTGKTINELSALFEIAQDVELCSFAVASTHPFVKSVCTTYLEAMRVAVARLGKRLLSFDPSLPAKVLARDPTFEKERSDELLLYVAKECLRYSYFDKKRSDPEFDLRIHTLSRLLQEAGRENRKFSKILTEYTSRCPQGIDGKEITDSFCYIFHHLDLLASSEPSIDLNNRSNEDIYWFAAAHAWLLEIRIPLHVTQRVATLYSLAEEKLKRAARLRGFEVYCSDFAREFAVEETDSALYRLLLLALWGESERTRKGAQKTLEARLQKTPIAVHNDPVIQGLLDKFYLRKAIDFTSLDVHEKQYLMSLLMRYVADSSGKIAYDKAHGLDVMEEVLYAFVKDLTEPCELKHSVSNPPLFDRLNHLIFCHRPGSLFGVWKQAMDAYIALKTVSSKGVLPFFMSDKYNTLFIAQTQGKGTVYEKIFTNLWANIVNKFQIKE